MRNATNPQFLLYGTHLVWQTARERKNRSLMCRFFGQALQRTLLQKTKVDSATARSFRSCRSAPGGRFAPTLHNSAGRLPHAVIHVAGHRLCLSGLKKTTQWRRPRPRYVNQMSAREINCFCRRVVIRHGGCDGNSADCCLAARGNTV